VPTRADAPRQNAVGMVGALQTAGPIDDQRGIIAVRDRAGLERANATPPSARRR
jgi:hypothetical protein